MTRHTGTPRDHGQSYGLGMDPDTQDSINRNYAAATDDERRLLDRRAARMEHISNLVEHFRASDEPNGIGPFGTDEGGAWMCADCAAEAENIDNDGVTPREVGYNGNDIGKVNEPRCCSCGEGWNGW